MVDINFFESYVEKPKKYNKNRVLIIGITGLLGLSLSIYPLFKYREIESLNRELSLLEENIGIHKASGKIESITNKKIMVEEMKQQIQQFEDLEAKIFTNQLISDELLDDISNCMSNEIFLTSIHALTDDIEVRGNAKHKFAIAQFEYNLRNTKTFKDVFVPTIDEKDGDYEFLITFRIKDVNDDET